jgi:hypothetical protein
MLKCSMSSVVVSSMVIGPRSNIRDCIAIMSGLANGRCCSRFCALSQLNTLLIYGMDRPSDASSSSQVVIPPRFGECIPR